jgi:hypothetical protein
MGEKRNVYRLFVGKPEGKGPLGRHRLRGWIILSWIAWDSLEWISMVEDRGKCGTIVNAVMTMRVV